MKKIERDRARLAYEETGSGGPPLLFAHGLSCGYAMLGVALLLMASACQPTPVRAVGEAVVANPVVDECAGPLHTPPAPPPARFTQRTAGVNRLNRHYVF